jgi:hypothetical protein
LLSLEGVVAAVYAVSKTIPREPVRFDVSGEGEQQQPRQDRPVDLEGDKVFRQAARRASPVMPNTFGEDDKAIVFDKECPEKVNKGSVEENGRGEQRAPHGVNGLVYRCMSEVSRV